jgi:nucleotide-binding universal stress UspA family protein
LSFSCVGIARTGTEAALASFLKEERHMASSFDTSRAPEEEAIHSPMRALPAQGHGIRRVLVCLDRSPFSEVCLPYAVCIGKTFGSTLTLLHVLETRHERSGPHSTDAVGWEISRREASEYLERLERQATDLSGQRVDVRLEQGHPAERITALAHELGADLTVLGSHGEGGIAAWNLGSTVQQVLEVARGSVLVARSSFYPAPSEVCPKRILVPLDGSPRTESVLPTATRIANAHGGQLVLVHVVEEPQPTGVLRAEEDLELARELATRLESRAQRYLEHIRDRLAREGTPVRALVVRHVDGRQALLELAQSEQVDLVVLSAHGATCNAERPFGSVTAHLLAHSVVPLLVLQDLTEPDLQRAGDVVDEEVAPPLRASFAPGAS